jgi:hypothetical protein
MTENDVIVEVATCSENEIVIEISPDKMNEKDDGAGDEDDNDDDDDDSENKTCGAETEVGIASSQHCTNRSTDNFHNAEPVSQLHGVHTTSQKYRSMSESSGDEFVSICNGQSY